MLGLDEECAARGAQSHSALHRVAVDKTLEEPVRVRRVPVEHEAEAPALQRFDVGRVVHRALDVSNFFLTFGEFLANFERLVLGCIETNLCK